MKCDLCDKPATVHEQTIRAGQVTERHLCESCAGTGGVCVPPPPSLAALISQFYTPAVAAVPAPTKPGPKTAGACAACGLTFAKFKETGLLGCPVCYSTFEQPLMSLLERAHEGGTHHVGKCPRTHAITPNTEPRRAEPLSGVQAAAPTPSPSAGAAPAEKPLAETVEQVRQSLVRLLQQAIKTEDYKEAARIRDHLRRIEEMTAQGLPQPPARTPAPSAPQPQSPAPRPGATPSARRPRRTGADGPSGGTEGTA